MKEGGKPNNDWIVHRSSDVDILLLNPILCLFNCYAYNEGKKTKTKKRRRESNGEKVVEKRGVRRRFINEFIIVDLGSFSLLF